MDKSTLQQTFQLNDIQMKQLDEYASFLVEYNEKINLTAITEYSEILEKHFYDSMLPLLHKDIQGTLADVGTGAGFPGVVLKIARPDLKVTLIEPLHKRCVFLEELIQKLGLQDIEVLNVRGEDYALKNREIFDVVTARAVTNLPALIEICGAMVKIDGYFMALRGKDGEEELLASSKAMKTMGFEQKEVYVDYLSDDSKRVCAFLQKVAKTPKSFPRKYSIIKKEPLCQK